MVGINRYSGWRYLLVATAIAIGVLYSVPNLYGEDPAVQISTRSEQLFDNLSVSVTEALQQIDITPMAMEESDSHVLLRFADQDLQLKAADHLRVTLGEQYTVALNLAPKTPDWLRSINATPMRLGLDLRGGVHFLLQVDMDAAVKQRIEGLADSIRSHLREKKLRYRAVTPSARQISLRFEDAAVRDAALAELENEFSDLSFATDNLDNNFSITAEMREAALEQERKNALTQNITTLRNRVNELGVAEPVIQQQGRDRIVVQLPGIQDTTDAKRLLGATATLEYRLVHGTYSDWLTAAQSGRTPVDARLYYDRNGQPVLLKRSVIVTGDNVVGAVSGFDQQSNSPAVFVTLDGKGASRMAEISGDNIGNPMGVVYIEIKYEDKQVDGKIIKQPRKVEQVVSVATIRDQLGKKFQTTGLEQGEARELALLLRAGSLRAPMQIIEERTVGPSLGAENIQRGFHSTWAGFAAIAVFMIIYYMMFGVTAVIALGVNVILLIGLLSMLPTTLTLPGMAGIALTIGMAIDANVLINERIREELRNGNTPQASIHAGYDRAFATIVDSNVTTFIVGLSLFAFGSGPVRGFAVVLCLGILTSIFSSVLVSRALVNLIYGRRARLTKLGIGNANWHKSGAKSGKKKV
jgi:preprotein translocase subunit SecD